MDTEPPATQPSAGGRKTVVLSLLVGLAFAAGALGVTMLVSAQDRGGPAGSADAPGLGPVSGAESMPMPATELPGFGEDAAPVALAAFRGTPLVVNFWASWCAPCVAEMPELQDMSEALAGRATVLGVNYRDPDHDAARAFVDELAITYELASDPTGDFLNAVRGIGMPTTLLVDEAGTIVYRHTGILDEEQLSDLMERYLGIEA
ncbi:MAG: TlpA disulfide reductase family protein [Egibacteraceae bacterium]